MLLNTERTDLVLMDLKEHIFGAMYDAKFEFDKLAEGRKEVTGEQTCIAYGKLKGLQSLLDATGLYDEYVAWKENNGLEY